MTSAKSVQKIFTVGPKQMAQRLGLAAWLAAAGVATVAVAPGEAVAARINTYGLDTQGLSGDQIAAPQTLSPAQWEQKMSREGHGQTGALLTKLYRSLAAPISLGQEAAQDRAVAQTMVLRAQWIYRLNQSVAPGQVQHLLNEFHQDLIRASGCGQVTDEQKQILGFDDRSWDQFIDQRRGGFDDQPYRGRAEGSITPRDAQARLDSHARHLGVRWLRAPWEASHDASVFARVEQEFYNTHTQLARVTRWSFSPVGLRGRIAWDVSGQSGVEQNGHNVTIKGGDETFNRAWFSVVQNLAERVPAQQRNGYRHYNSMQGRAERLVDDVVYTTMNGGDARYSVDRAVQGLISNLPNRILNARQDRLRNGFDITDVDYEDFRSALYSNDTREMTMWSATFRDIPGRVLNYDQQQRYGQPSMGCATTRFR